MKEAKIFWPVMFYVDLIWPLGPSWNVRHARWSRSCSIGRATFFASGPFRPVFKFLIGQYFWPIRIIYLKTFLQKNLLDGNLFPFVWWCCVNSFLVSNFETYASTYAKRDSDWLTIKRPRGIKLHFKVSMQFSFIQMQFLKQLVSI